MAADVVQKATGTAVAALNAKFGTSVELSVVVPAVNVVFAALNSVPVENPSDHPPVQPVMVVATRAVAEVTTERVGILTLPKLVDCPPVFSVTMPGSICQKTRPPPFRLASLIAS